MGLAGIEVIDASALGHARTLAKLWEVPLLVHGQATNGVKAVVREAALGLGFVDPKRGKPFFCDFQTRIWHQLLQTGLPKNHIFRRALGVRDQPLKVLDATAGFGHDALMALATGCEVFAVEQSSVVCAVLRDGLDRAAREDTRWSEALRRFVLIESDAKQVLVKHKDSIDVVYLDPMFDKPKKSAKSPKEMQLLQELLEPSRPEDDEAVFAAALQCARLRVVVKRPLKARAFGMSPTHTFKGQSIRYDVYARSTSI